MDIIRSEKPTAVITGASRGIGEATARLFAAKGYNVVINYNRSAERAEKLRLEIGENAIAVKADVRNTDEVKEMFEEAYAKFGRIDVLVNNAGIARQQVLSDVSDKDLDEITDVNFGGTFRCSREVLPYMLKTHSGSIVNISSMWGISGGSCESVYSASKAAIIGLTKALAKELGMSGIRVNCVAPGVVNTDMNKCHTEETMNELAEETPLGRIGKPEEIAKVIYFLASSESSFVTGQILGADGGFAV